MENYKQLTPQQVRFIVELIGAMIPPSQIQAKFSSMYEGKEISPKLIKEVELEHAQEVSEYHEMYLKYIGSCPIAHTRIRMDILYKIATEAMKERLSHTVSVNGESIPISKPDLAIALKALEIARREMFEYDKKQEEQRIASSQNARNIPRKLDTPTNTPPEEENNNWSWE